jgi:hypothetical protein
MVTVHRLGNLRFVIFSNDHEPAHVHVVGPASEAKIQLSGTNGLTLVWQHGFGRADLRRIMFEVRGQRDMLMKRWSDIHG